MQTWLFTPHIALQWLEHYNTHKFVTKTKIRLLTQIATAAGKNNPIFLFWLKLLNIFVKSLTVFSAFLHSLVDNQIKSSAGH